MLIAKTFKRSLVIALIAVLFVVFSAPIDAFGSTTATGTITYGSGAYVRQSPTVNSSALICLSHGTTVAVNYKTQGTDNSYTWYNITYSSTTGFVRSDLMSVSGNVPTGDPGSGSGSGSGSTVTEMTPQVWQVTYPGGANVRKEPTTGSTALTYLYTGTKITVNGKCASTNSSDKLTWYRMYYTDSSGTKINGYMREDTITSCAGPGQPGEEDAEYVASLKEKGFPDTYIPYLVQLHKLHPAWVFTATDTGLNWSDVLAKENKSGVSVISYVFPDYYFSHASDCYINGHFKSWDSGGWYQASNEVIAYYLDPRNFLTETGVFQFMTHTFDASTQNIAGLNAMVAGTFLTGPCDGSTYVDVIYNAGKNNLVNPYVIASIILTEQGKNGTGGCISGTVKGYEGYYNFFNIGAYKTSTMTAVERGCWYAKTQGWDTRTKSINGGAKFYYDEYVKPGQYTLYLKKWNVMNGLGAVATHQYMSNVMGAELEASKLAKAYSNVADTPINFLIPIYKDMPENTVLPAEKCVNSGHSWDSYEIVVEPSCTQQGVRVFTCSVCGLKKRETMSGSGHTWGDWSHVDGTETHVHSCTACGKTETQKCEFVYDERELFNRPSVIDRKCSVCGDVEGSYSVDRIYGNSRYDTAVQVAEKYKSIADVSQFDKVIIAYGDNFADALSGSSLSIANGAPVLLVNGKAVTQQTVRDYIRDNVVSGGQIYILGGTGVISDSFVSTLADKKYNITRLSGKDRYMTNLEVLNNLEIGNDILVCSGESFPDAVTASQTGKPVMLVGKHLTDAQKEFLASVPGKNLCIIGGTGVVSSDLENELRVYSSNVSRIYGSNRGRTANAVANYFFGSSATSVVMASGESFADSICAGIIANKTSSPILFAGENGSYYTAAAEYMSGRHISSVYAIGGKTIVTPAFAGTAMYQSQ